MWRPQLLPHTAVLLNSKKIPVWLSCVLPRDVTGLLISQMTSGHIKTYSFPNSGQRLLPLRAGLFTFQLLRDSSMDSNLSSASAAETTSSRSRWQAPAACWQRAGSQSLDKQHRSAAKCCLLGDSGRRNLDQPPHFIA